MLLRVQVAAETFPHRLCIMKTNRNCFPTLSHEYSGLAWLRKKRRGPYGSGLLLAPAGRKPILREQFPGHTRGGGKFYGTLTQSVIVPKSLNTGRLFWTCSKIFDLP